MAKAKAAVLAVAVLATSGLLALAPPPGQAAATAAVQQPMPGKTSLFWGADGFRHARFQDARFDPRLGGVRLTDSRLGAYASSGWVELGELSFPAFDRAVPSWNADCPEGTFVVVELAWKDESGSWSPYLEVARWGDEAFTVNPPKEERAKKAEGGRINEDTLELAKLAGRLKLRVQLNSSRPDASPLLSLLGVATVRKDRQLVENNQPGPAWGKAIPAPPRSQGAERADISSRICGPTSASMALAAFGVALPTAEVAGACYDRLNDIYGNWPFLAAGMSQLLRRAGDRLPNRPGAVKAYQSFVHYAPDWKDVEAEVLAGNVAIASIHYGPHELTASPTTASEGHLVLVRGFTRSGDVVVNDPAGRQPQMVLRTYQRSELHRARHGGPVIVLRPYLRAR